MKVVKLDKARCDEFVRQKHYSRRASIFWAGFGLVEDGMVVGVVVYGQPSPPIQRHAFRERDFRMYELSRLVIQTSTRNAASFLIGNSLKMLERPCAVVSYSDMEFGHAGVVYQATNWIYTGATVSHDHVYLVDGKRTHPMTLRDRGITNPKEWAAANAIKTVAPQPKHRYFFVCGDRRQCATMRKKLVYPVVTEYPKTQKTMYDAGPSIQMPFEQAAQAVTEQMPPPAQESLPAQEPAGQLGLF